jgi:hypothetical protein
MNRDAFTYVITSNAPHVPADEVESSVPSIEVRILWESTALQVTHLTPPRSFFVGEPSHDGPSCDYFVPGEIIGAPRVPIVVSRGEITALVILPRTHGHIDVPGEDRITLAELIARGGARRSSEVAGAYEYDLPLGSAARLQFEGSALVFQVAIVNAGKRLPVGLFPTAEPAAWLFTATSFLLHVGVIAALAFFMPKLGGDDSEAIDRDRILMMKKLLNAAAMREMEERDTPEASAATSEPQGGTGAAEKGEAGSMGKTSANDNGHKYGVLGPRDNPDPHLAKQAALQNAADFGVIAYITAMQGGDPNAPLSLWGRTNSSGRDDKSALGKMFGNTIDDSMGAGGLDLTGGGESGGGWNVGIGLREFGGLDRGGDTGPDQGIANGRGRPSRGHVPTGPRIREPEITINGHLRPEVIQRIVRQNFGRFRFCYEGGIRQNPNLQGRVAVKFIVARSGSVGLSADGGSDLPDSNVVQCVVRAFAELSFPPPEAGMVTVVYPIVFSPGDW